MLSVGDVEGTNGRKRAEEALRQSERELTIRNQIADIFLIVPDEDTYGAVLQVILEAMESEHGFFGYIDEDGNMVAPSLTREIWDQCQIPDKNIVFPRETWGGMWGRAMMEKRTLCANKLLHVPEGHIPVLRAMTVPIVHQGELIGVITVGNKTTDYDGKDQRLLEIIDAHIAPVLHARLQRDRQERERKRAEEALEEYSERLEDTVEQRTAELRASEEKLRAQYKGIPIPTYTWQGVEDDLVLVDYNDAAVPITQGKIADFVGITASEMYRDTPEVLEEFSRCLTEKISIEREMSYRFKSTGESKHLAVKYAFVPPDLVLVHTEDITERKRAEEALKASEERYRSLFDGLPVGLYRTTSEGQILDVNPALVKMLGYPDPESLLAVNAADLYVAPEDRERWRARIDPEGVVRGVEVQLRRYDRIVIWVRHTARAIRNAAPPVIYYEGAVEDITEWRQAQAALMEAGKLAIAGRLATLLAHEINNPLQTVIGCLGLAEETLAEKGDTSRYLQVAHEELRRTADIVAQLRDLHRPSKPEDKEPTHVNALLEQVLDLSRKQCESQGIEVLRAMADLPALPLAADQIKQVLLNLLLNAIEAMPQGGRLQVSTTYTSQPAGARIAFTDSGVGIAPDVLLHVFEPFYSTRPEGLGLGLFISRNIVKQHGGQIEVDSRVGEGATFTVWLPA